MSVFLHRTCILFPSVVGFGLELVLLYRTKLCFLQSFILDLLSFHKVYKEIGSVAYLSAVGMEHSKSKCTYIRA